MDQSRDAVIESVTSYVPGVDQAYIKAFVTAVDASGSTLAIGNTQVDYTSASGTPQVGQLVAFTGVQATSSSVIAAARGPESAQAVMVPLALVCWRGPLSGHRRRRRRKRRESVAGGDGTSGIGAGWGPLTRYRCRGDGTSGIGAGG